MDQYPEHDRRFPGRRIDRFRHRSRPHLDGRLSEEQVRPLPLPKGLHLELHAAMLRVAIPYGEVDARQMRCLADVARRYDRGHGHFTTRQNIQFNGSRRVEVGDLLDALSRCGLYAVQTSGNPIRNISTDYLAGIATDEAVDPRPYCELIRQWSATHPECAGLPPEFKIAVSGAATDRAAIELHDIGLRLHRDEADAVRVAVWVGGGLGRTPLLAQRLHADLPAGELLTYLEAILRVYNRHARRDPLSRSRLKILVRNLGINVFRERVEQAWGALREGASRLPRDPVDALAGRFADPDLGPAPLGPLGRPAQPHRAAFARWRRNNVLDHRAPGHAAVVIPLKRDGHAPGNLDADGMLALADLAERFSHGRIRITRTQNLLLPYVRQAELAPLWQALEALDLARPSHGQATDLVCCPGADDCPLAQIRTPSIAEAIRAEIQALGLEPLLGPMRINLSGCVNGCGHHQIGDIGLLGVARDGRDGLQISLAGHGGQAVRIGQRVGPAIPAEQAAAAVRELLRTFLARRRPRETLRETLDRLGLQAFRAPLDAAFPSPGIDGPPAAACAR